MSAILDFYLMGIIKMNFDSFFGLAIPENMGLDIKF